MSGEALGSFVELYTNPHTTRNFAVRLQPSIPAASRVAFLAYLLTGAAAGIHMMRSGEPGERIHVRAVVLALTTNRVQAGSGNKPQPREVFEDRGFKDGATAKAIVILDTQEHARAEQLR